MKHQRKKKSYRRKKQLKEQGRSLKEKEGTKNERKKGGRLETFRKTNRKHRTRNRELIQIRKKDQKRHANFTENETTNIEGTKSILNNNKKKEQKYKERTNE